MTYLSDRIRKIWKTIGQYLTRLWNNRQRQTRLASIEFDRAAEILFLEDCWELECLMTDNAFGHSALDVTDW